MCLLIYVQLEVASTDISWFEIKMITDEQLYF